MKYPFHTFLISGALVFFPINAPYLITIPFTISEKISSSGPTKCVLNWPNFGLRVAIYRKIGCLTRICHLFFFCALKVKHHWQKG